VLLSFTIHGRDRDSRNIETGQARMGGSPFEFMTSEVSSEKPKDLLVGQVADRIRAARARGGKVLAVCGPAVIHTGIKKYIRSSSMICGLIMEYRSVRPGAGVS